MTRLVRRTSLLVAFCLLALVATAYADCAWVLWSPAYEGAEFKTSRTTGQLSIAEAYVSRDECRVNLLRLDTAIKKERGQAAPIGALCLPDTVDPREPKGK